MAPLILVAFFAFADDAYRFEGVERVVAFGDVHGTHDALVQLLQETGVIDADLGWSGGRTHLVSTGDLVSRGDRGREVIELLMRLEGEAAAAGGALHALLGNHEMMSLSGDLRYVSPGEYERFGGADARRAAFAPDGHIGRWLLERPVLVVIDGMAFLHGGLSAAIEGLTLEQVNKRSRRAIRGYVTGWHELLAAGVVTEADGFHAVRERVLALAGDAAHPQHEAIARMAAAVSDLPYRVDGPLWYRGTSLCHPATETAVLQAALASIGARRVTVGHTVTQERRVTSRMDGRAYRIDTGMNPVYQGRASALVIEGGEVRAHYAGEGLTGIHAEPADPVLDAGALDHCPAYP